MRCTRGSFLSVFILNVFIIFRFLVLITVEVSDQPFRVILKRAIHFIRREMPARITFECVARGDVQLVNSELTREKEQ